MMVGGGTGPQSLFTGKWEYSGLLPCDLRLALHLAVSFSALSKVSSDMGRMLN